MTIKTKSQREKYYQKLGFFKPEPKAPPNTPNLSPRNGNLIIHFIPRDPDEKIYPSSTPKYRKR